MAIKHALIGACVGATLTGVISWICSWTSRTSQRSADNEDMEVEPDKVLFFPAAGPTPCNSVLQATTCRRRNCIHNHSTEHPLAVLLASLRSSKQTLDIAIYTFSFSFIKDEILASQRRGVRVRVLVDAEQVNAGGCVIEDLLKAGIQIRKGSDDFYLHHKFAIIDGDLLVNGSLNWSRAGVMGNHENVLITKRAHLVHAFQDEFSRMWKLYDPSRS